MRPLSINYVIQGRASCATRARPGKTNNNNELAKSFSPTVSTIKSFANRSRVLSRISLKSTWNSITRWQWKREREREKAAIKEACNWQSDDSWLSDPYVSPLPLDDSGFYFESTCSEGGFCFDRIRELTTLLTNWHLVWWQLNPGARIRQNTKLWIKGERRQRSVNGTTLRKGEEMGKRVTQRTVCHFDTPRSRTVHYCHANRRPVSRVA